jgi:hypothetical protein
LNDKDIAEAVAGDLPVSRPPVIHAGRKVFLGTVLHEWASLPVHNLAGSDVRTIRLCGGSSIGGRRSRQNAVPRHRC